MSEILNLQNISLAQSPMKRENLIEHGQQQFHSNLPREMHRIQRILNAPNASNHERFELNANECKPEALPVGASLSYFGLMSVRTHPSPLAVANTSELILFPVCDVVPFRISRIQRGDARLTLHPNAWNRNHLSKSMNGAAKATIRRSIVFPIEWKKDCASRAHRISHFVRFQPKH